jgi:hypothetical protein
MRQTGARYANYRATRVGKTLVAGSYPRGGRASPLKPYTGGDGKASGNALP